MTSEEKAEKYATENLPDGYTKVNYEKKEAYLAGFADGRKESIEQMKDKNGYEKCLEDVYAELDKIRKSETDFYIREAADVVRLKLKLELTRKQR